MQRYLNMLLIRLPTTASNITNSYGLRRDGVDSLVMLLVGEGEYTICMVGMIVCLPEIFKARPERIVV